MPRNAEVLGAYVLPGPAMDPLAGLHQTAEAERIGLGSVWLSELQGPLKDAGALLGVMGYMTERIDVGTSITHFGTRHPMVLASWGLTMQVLTDGRFQFGFGRSVSQRWKMWGIDVPTIQSMEDLAGILRSLFAHESVTYEGPAGTFESLDFDHFPDVPPPPLLLAAIGPKTLALGGRAFDAVLLHPFLTRAAVARSREIVRSSAAEAGRDPDSVVVYHQLVMAPDLSPAETDLAVLARAAAYFSFPGFCDPILAVNAWDDAELEPLRTAAMQAMKDNAAAGSPLKGRDVFIEPGRLFPTAWLEETAAVGSATECARRLHDYLDAGADKIVIHGVTPDALEPTVKAFNG
jgi:5,10-methylenetetrahydromethanopterin reductase